MPRYIGTRLARRQGRRLLARVAIWRVTAARRLKRAKRRREKVPSAEELLLLAIRELACRIGHTPTLADWEAWPRRPRGLGPVIERLGGWVFAVEEALGPDVQPRPRTARDLVWLMAPEQLELLGEVPLSPSQRQLLAKLEELGEGATMAEVARALGLSRSRVQQVVARMRRLVEWEQEDRALAEAIRAAAPKARLDALTGAEREVLRLLHEGLTPAEIAQRLSIRRARLHRTIRCLHLYLEEGRRGVPGELSPLPR